jgi:hypothetical protein
LHTQAGLLLLLLCWLTLGRISCSLCATSSCVQVSCGICTAVRSCTGCCQSSSSQPSPKPHGSSARHPGPSPMPYTLVLVWRFSKGFVASLQHGWGCAATAVYVAAGEASYTREGSSSGSGWQQCCCCCQQ